MSSSDRPAYLKVIETLKRRRKGVTVADVAAATALPLPTVRELVPRAADEFRGRLKVTESGEILYDFPQGFTSRYRGFSARLDRFLDKFIRISCAVLSWLFKAWILVMLLGYFALFMIIALAALTLSVAGSSSNSNNRSRGSSAGGFFLATHIFDLIIRLWFYSELTKSMTSGAGQAGRGYYGNGPYSRGGAAGSFGTKPKGRPLHKAVFSFVFGEKDPNRDAETMEKRALIAYVSSNRGLIGLPEYMAITGLSPQEAEEGLLAFCAEFGGLPEATEDGTIVYRFGDILLRADKKNSAGSNAAAPGSNAESAVFSAPLRRLRSFSANSKTMNTWFGIINSVNLLFGGYFSYQAIQTGIIRTSEELAASPRLYGITYALSTMITDNPQPLLFIGLGIVPLLFSLFFWIIPALRLASLGNENQNIKKQNLRKIGFNRIWEKLRGITATDIENPAVECRPKDLPAEQEKIIREMGTYSMPEVEVDAGNKTLYNFNDLEREKQALAASRAAVKPEDFDIGKVVFDSGE
jgi:hypothetical protein